MNLKRIYDSFEQSECAELIEQGYILHATNATFDKFDSSYIQGDCRAMEGYGFYFTDMAYKVREYGDKLLAVKKDDFSFFDYSTPVSYTNILNEIFPTYEIYRMENRLDEVGSMREFDDINHYINECKGQHYNETYDTAFLRLAEKHSDYNYGNLWHNAPIIGGKTCDFYLVERLIDVGYDGAYYDGVYTIFNIDKLNEKFVVIK